MLPPITPLAVMALANLAFLSVLGSLMRSGVAGVREVAASMLLCIVGLLFYCAQALGSPHGELVVLAGNILYAAGACMLYIGLCRFLGGPRFGGGVLAGMLLFVLANIAAPVFKLPPDFSVAASSLFFGALALGMAYAVWRGLSLASSRYSYWFTFCCTAFAALVYLLRVVIHLPGIDRHFDAWRTPIFWDTVFLALDVLIVPCLMLGFIMMVHDRMLGERQREADTDHLTGLLTRKAWWREVERLCAKAAGSNAPLSVLILDLDHFKQVNDRYGHDAGDAVLRHFSCLIAGVVRSDDAAGRFGGEEFALAFLNASIDQARGVAARLSRVLDEAPCSHEDRELRCTFSAGLAQWYPGESVENAIRQADRALYRAKEAGRNQCAVAAPAR